MFWGGYQLKADNYEFLVAAWMRKIKIFMRNTNYFKGRKTLLLRIIPFHCFNT
jgi:hypothetical protein